ncbi:MAG: tRNA (adenosine(37)-N6)-dimethylallyltransferase MiaA, partial [bacterium]
SRQLYRGTEVCTDIPSGRWRSFGGRRRAYVVDGVPHYLLGSESPTRPLTLDEYQRRAVWRLREIASRGRLPILAGGTGLYVRAVVGNFSGPRVAPDQKFRSGLDGVSTTELFRRLQRIDPDYAERIGAGNRRYIVRALEVQRATGRPFSEQQGRGEPQFDWLELGVDRPREELYRRIDERVDWMFGHGLLPESGRIFSRYGASARISTSLGYAQLVGYFSGQYGLEEAQRRIKRDTRHYARRQLTWLRRDRNIRWVSGLAEARKIVHKFIG